MTRHQEVDVTTINRVVPEIQLHSSELTELLQLGEQLVLELQIDNVLQLVADAACKVVNAETLVVPIIDEHRQSFTYRAGSGKYAELIAGQTFPISEGSCGWVMQQRQPLLFGEGMDFGMNPEEKWRPGVASSLLVPLICRGIIIGGLSAMGKNGDKPFNTRDLTLMTLFANQASVAIDNARIFGDLHEEKERAQVTLNSITDAVITTDKDGYILYSNAVARDICQLHDEIPQQKLMEIIRFIDAEDQQPQGDPVSECLETGLTILLEGNTLVVGARGDTVAVECVVSVIHDANHKKIGTVMVMHDVSERRQMQYELLHQARHDPLTNLYNRRYFTTILESTLESVAENNHAHAILYMDLDNFKIVNDTCGHPAGDALLKGLTQRIQKVVRKSDLLARLGGDEFGCLLFNCDVDKALRLAHQLIDTIQSYRFSSHNREFTIGVSIGLAILDNQITDIEQILSNADIACYTAKGQGGNCVHIYDIEDEHIDRTHGEMHWVPRIRKALNEDGFELYLQPILSLQGSDPMQHYEALIRYRDEHGEIVTPERFIIAAERYRLIQDIDKWVCDTVLGRIYSQFDNSNLPSISINLSGSSVGSKSFRQHLLRRLEVVGLHNNCLCFEITETSAMENLHDVSIFIDELRQRGCFTALDDFGSGLSSFGYLKQLPVDFLKIDGQLIKGVAENQQDYGLVEAIHRIGHLLGKKTVAEWVKDDATLQCLTAMGIDYGQGFVIGKPKPWYEVLCSSESPTDMDSK